MKSTDAQEAVRVVHRHVPELPVNLHPNPLVHRLLAARGVTDPDELSFPLGSLPRPDTLLHINDAVGRLLQAREDEEQIVILGDYDCDGATSTCVAMLGLRMLGFRNIDYLIPSRFEFGYGLSPGIVEVAWQLHRPSLILTVDNGVASVDGVACARQLGIDVLVTDHHLAPALLPDAAAIINPNLPGSPFPARNLAGVGVIFYTLLAVRRALAERGDAFAGGALGELLDLVAIGTVADVVPLDRTNRTLVEQGLRRIRAGATRPGVLALLASSGRQVATMSTRDIGFGIAPRLNAAGRLDDMSIGVRCLLAETDQQARDLAATLNDLNQSRRDIERDMRASAERQLQNDYLSELQVSPSFTVCLMDEDWHEGVIGILAGRIKETLHRPCALFTADGENTLKGSVRSIRGVHIRDVLQDISTGHPGMIHKFGGHAMAAGLTLQRDQFDSFCQSFEARVCQVMDGRLKLREYEVDGSLSRGERTLENAQMLALLMPWGQGFDAPLFADRFRVSSRKIVGTGHLKLMLTAEEGERPVDAIAFNREDTVEIGDSVYVVYALEVNTWRDRQQLQLRVLHLEPDVLR
ncbi:MAG: single-stranded-DNA-specific exonuclease RecJ [Granulosicoccus sp.]|nr:single-stranded-DNA-specific exonuclease RecJ [Granulosicoccus sp.]